jgi:hypothetical protein
MRLSLRNLLRNLTGCGSARRSRRSAPSFRPHVEQLDQRLVPTANLYMHQVDLGSYPNGGVLQTWSETPNKQGASLTGEFLDWQTHGAVLVKGQLNPVFAGWDQITVQGTGAFWSNGALVIETVKFNGLVNENNLFTEGTLQTVDTFLYLNHYPPYSSGQTTSAWDYGWFETIPQ